MNTSRVAVGLAVPDEPMTSNRRRELARKAGNRTYFSLEFCVNGHNERYVHNSQCLGCIEERSKRRKR